jgi:predicted amidohydrolase YtcJ
MARAWIAASIQPIHLRSDVDRAREAWGDRAERRGFLLRALLDAGVTVAFGTDAPVEPADPWPGLAIAVTRTGSDWSDRRPFGPAEAIGLEQAIRAATVGPAVVAGELDRGRLTAGQRADFIVIGAAAMAEPVEPDGPLTSTRPDLVAVAGRVVFER